MVKGKKKIYILLAVVMVVAVMAEVLFAHPHYHMLWNEVPGFDILIGFAGAWFLIVLAKIVMSKLLQRKEGYYDEAAAQGSEDTEMQDPDGAKSQGSDGAKSQGPEKGGMSHV